MSARPLDNSTSVDTWSDKGFPPLVHKKITGLPLWFSTRQACSHEGMDYTDGIRG